MSVDENKRICRRVVDAANSGDVNAIDELFAADYVDHSRPGFPPGPEGPKKFFRMFKAAFPDGRFELQEMIGEGDKVAVRGVIRGTHRVDLMGIPATGKSVVITLIDINRIVGGRIAERWASQDDLGLLQQLGVVPASEPAMK